MQKSGVTVGQAVVGKPAALRVEILVPRLQGFEEVRQVPDFRVGRLLQAA